MQVARSTCSKFRVSGSLPVCDGAIVMSIRQARDMLETAQSVAAVDELSGEEEVTPTFLAARTLQYRPASDDYT